MRRVKVGEAIMKKTHTHNPDSCPTMMSSLQHFQLFLPHQLFHDSDFSQQVQYRRMFFETSGSMLVSIDTFMCFYQSVPSSLSPYVPSGLFGTREGRGRERARKLVVFKKVCHHSKQNADYCKYHIRISKY